MPPLSNKSIDLNSDGDSKKFIRTFESDMEVLKKGGQPDLKPLEPSAKSAEPKIVITETTPPPPVTPAPAPVQPPPPPAPPAPVAPPEPPVKLELESRPAALQTYSGDFADRLKNTKSTTATVLAAEQDATTGAPSAPTVPERPSRGGILSILAGMLLVLVGGLGAYIAYTRYAQNTNPVPIASTITAPIFVDERQKVFGTSTEEVHQAFATSLTHPLAANHVRLLYNDGTTTSLFTFLHEPAPNVLLRNITDQGSAVGVISAEDQTISPFFILSVASYSDTFSGMLSWEPTMLRDVADLYPAYPAPEVVVATTTTKGKQATTTVPRAPIASKLFHDEVVSNHDVRIYRDADSRSVIVYGYWNQSTLVIARDPATFTEILDRLATSRAHN